MKMPSLFSGDRKTSKPALSHRKTSNTTVAQILEKFAPAREGTTSTHLVSMGKNQYFVVVQGPEADQLTSMIIQYIEALYERAEPPDDNDD